MGVHLITGSDEVLLGSATSDLVHELVAGGDRSLMVDDLEVGLPDSDSRRAVIDQALDAARTIPFLTERRIVVMRSLSACKGDELEPVVRYLADPSPTTELVMVWGGGRVLKALDDAVKAAGGHKVGTSAPARKEELGAWIDERASGAGLRLDGSAKALLVEWLGEERGRLIGLLETLEAAFGGDERLGADDVRPFLGEAGGVPPWDLTDAIDRGDTQRALELLTRMLHSGERHSLQIMAILHQHYARLLKLEGSGAESDQAAMALLGLQKSFPAKKALNQARALGSAGITRAIALLAAADLDLRGRKDWPEGMVMEVLVARLSRLGSRTGVSSRR